MVAHDVRLAWLSRAALCIALTLAAGRAAADGPSSLESLADEDPQVLFRRALYDFSQGDYGGARTRLEAVLDPPRLKNEDDLLEARKTLGILYFLRSEEKRAREQFELVFLVKPDAQLDVYSTAPPVLRFFDLVRAETRLKSQEFAHVLELRKRGFEAPRIIERRQIRHVELLAFMPFGIGQFQNGHTLAGVVLLCAEVLALGANVLGYIMGQLLGKDTGTISRSQEDLRYAWMAVQYAGLGAFVLTWAAGAIHARLHFQPVVTIDRDITPGTGGPKTAAQLGLRLSMTF